MKINRFWLLLCIALFVNNAVLHAQFSKKEEKDIEKAGKLAYKNDYSKAADIIMELIKDHENSPFLWDKAVEYKYKEYLAAKDLKFTFQVKANGGTTKEDTLVNKALDMLQNMDLSQFAYKRFINTCKEAQLRCEYPENASMYMRILFIDEDVDSAVSEKAMRYFNKAENAFGEKNYADAIKYYSKALEEEPQFYKAGLYLGDVYYLQEDYGKAAQYFREASRKHPNQLEPRKYLVDALSKMNKYDEALAASLDAIMVYTDATMYWKIEDIALLANKSFKRNWIPRRFPVHVASDTTTYKDELQKIQGQPWQYYAEAKQNVIKYCDKDGILQPNPVTKQKYLEAYCWEYMLSKSQDKSLDFARAMQAKDMLDCYVLFSESHFDLYSQTKHLSKNNPEKVKKYLNSLLVVK